MVSHYRECLLSSLIENDARCSRLLRVLPPAIYRYKKPELLCGIMGVGARRYGVRTPRSFFDLQRESDAIITEKVVLYLIYCYLGYTEMKKLEKVATLAFGLSKLH